MRDIELYRAILGVTAPWTVVSVDLDVNGRWASGGWRPSPSLRRFGPLWM